MPNQTTFRPETRLCRRGLHPLEGDNLAWGGCRVCRNQRMREYSRETRERRREYMREYHADRYAELKAIISKAKDRSCADCGGRFSSCAMDFDHVRGEKVASVAQLVGWRASPEKIREEIAKCELVCANCHRIRHHGEDE